MVGHAELLLRDAYFYLTCPVNVDQLTLATVMDHPMLSRMYRAHCVREMTNDNLSFYMATRAFQTWVTKCTSWPCV